MGQSGSSEQARSPFDGADPAPTASVPPSTAAPERVTLIPTVLQWSHGGRMVYVTGTFNNWAERIPMRLSRNDFTVCLNLPVGTFQYKFIVDNEWRFSPSQPLVQDAQGNVNNCITVLDEEVWRLRRAEGARARRRGRGRGCACRGRVVGIASARVPGGSCPGARCCSHAGSTDRPAAGACPQDFMRENIGPASDPNDGPFSNDPTLAQYGQSLADDAIQLAKDPPPLPTQLTVRTRRPACARATRHAAGVQPMALRPPCGRPSRPFCSHGAGRGPASHPARPSLPRRPSTQRVVLNSEVSTAPPTMVDELPPPLPCTLLHLCWQQPAQPEGSGVAQVRGREQRRAPRAIPYRCARSPPPVARTPPCACAHRVAPGVRAAPHRRLSWRHHSDTGPNMCRWCCTSRPD